MVIPFACPDVATLRRLAVGQLDPDQITRLQDHLAGCPDCLAAVADLPTDDPLLTDLRARPAGPEDEAVERLIERLRGAGPSSLADTVVRDAADTPAEGPGEADRVLGPAQGPGELGRLGPYRVLRVLGRGGMGIVFEAEDPQLRRTVALKVMKPAMARRPDARDRFLREAQAAAAIQHDHIVTIHQVGEDRGVPYLAMQLLSGETLERRLQRMGRRPVAELVRVGREVAKGLAAAHARGLIHRDVKPANIWIEAPGDGSVEAPPAGRVKLLDFGLARAAADAAHASQPGVLAGTPAYMAPEQASDGPIDHRADLFSLGCVLYRMATGELPFKGDKPLTVLWALTVQKPAPPRRLNPEVPAALSDLILRLLAKDPAARPQSAREVANALGAIDLSGAAAPAPPRPRRRSLTTVAVAVAVLLAAGGTRYGPTVYRLVTNKGQVVIETDDPDVTVVVKDKEQRVAVIDAKADREVTLKAGDYQVELSNAKLGLGLAAREFALTRGGKQIVRVRWEPPGPVRTLACPEVVWGAQFCLDGSHVLTAGGNFREGGKWKLGSDFALRLWDARTGREVRQLKDHTQIVRGLAVSADGKRAVSAGGEHKNAGPDWTLRLWDLETGKLIRRFDDKHTDVVRGVAASADGRRVVSAGADKSLRLWDAETGRETRCLDEGKTVYWSVDISPDGKRVLSGSADGKLRLWAADTGTLVRDLDACKDWGPVKLSPDGRFALSPGLTAERRGSVELWDLETKERVRHVTHESGWATTSAFSPDGKRFLTYGSDGTVRLWDVNGRELHRFKPPDLPEDTRMVSTAAVSPDGRFAVSAYWDRSVRVWKLPD